MEHRIAIDDPSWDDQHRHFSPPLDWTGTHTRQRIIQEAREITREDLDALNERAIRAILGNAAMVANAYPFEHTARTLMQEVRFHVGVGEESK